MNAQINDRVINSFYRELVFNWKQKGIAAKITGGQACLDYGMAEFTKDLDLIVSIEDIGLLMGELEKIKFNEATCLYRVGHGSPLSSPWLDGGWTSHFRFFTKDYLEPSIDIFTSPPRVLNSTETKQPGLLASFNTVAEMKKTKRSKDWNFVSGIGLRMLNEGDKSGIFHIYDCDLLINLVQKCEITEDDISKRPVLQLAKKKQALLARAIQTEIDFWKYFDKKRLEIYKNAWIKYFKETKKHPDLEKADLKTQHKTLLEIAENFLPAFPLQDHGVELLFSEVKKHVMLGLDRELLSYLPNTSKLERSLIAQRP